MSADRPNVLWYCTDQQRSDTIGALGNSEIHTPVLDRFVADGTAFAQAYCQSPICTPSRASFLTGRYPASTHVHRNGNDFFPTHERLLPAILRDSGYRCGLVGKLHLAGAQGRVEPRVDDGYHAYHWSHHPYPEDEWGLANDYVRWLEEEKGVDSQELLGGLRAAYGPGVDTEYHQTTWCTEESIRFIEANRDVPWLLSVNPFAPHPIYRPPKEFLDLYDPDTLSPPVFAETDVEHQEIFSRVDQQTRHAVDPRIPRELHPNDSELADVQGSASPASYDARLMKAHYYAEISLVDRQFGRILEALAATGQLQNTIVIFTSDHGELLGDHGLAYKGGRFYEALVHVPLIVSWPERFAAGRRSDALVELVDLAPTILEAAHLPVPTTMQGTSLIPLLSGDAPLHHHKDRVISEFNDALGPGTVPEGCEFGTHAVMVFDGRYKIVVYDGLSVGELYDLQNDPGETRDLWSDAEHLQLRAELLHRAMQTYMGTSDAGIKRTRGY